jgi:hypothetical protein
VSTCTLTCGEEMNGRVKKRNEADHVRQ